MSGFRKLVTVKRPATGSYVKGEYVPDDASTEIVIIASVQPASGRALEALPEGRRNSESYMLFTDIKLYTAEVSASKNPDLVVINSEDFEVVNVKSYQSGVISHYQVLVTKAVQ